MRPIERSILVIVNCQAAQSGIIPFPDVPELRQGVEVTGIEAYTVTDMNNTPNGQAVISEVDSALVTVTLTALSTEQWRQTPMRTLISRLNGGIWKESVPFLVNFQRSNITFNAASAAVAEFGVPFSIFYRTLSR